MNTLSIKYVTASWLLAAAVFLGFALQAFAQEAIESNVIISEEVNVSEALPADIFVPVEDILTPPSIVLLVSEPASTTEAVVMDESTTSQEVIVSEAVLSTDKDDYHPGETATIFGRFFAPLETFMIKVFGIDENNQNYTETEKEITADANGEFSFSYLLDSLYRPFYEVVVSTLGGEKIAETWFRDSSVGTYDQCSNDDGDGYAIADTGCRWTQGNIQSNNSTYFEGDSTVQRLWMEGYVPGSSHTITFKYGTTKGGSHAYDYLTTWNASENWVTVADRCQDVTGCTTASETTAVMQNDPNVTDSIEPAGASRLFTIRGATITNVSVPTIVTGSYAGDSETVVTIAFTVGAANGPMCSTKKVQGQDVTSCGMAVWFGAHVAKGSEWTAFNSTTGAGAIPGSPYHVALDAEDGTSIGQRDNQMQSAAIVQTSSITIIKDAVPNDAQDFAFTTTGTGLSGFSLDDDTNATLSNTKVFNSLTAGTYTITEAAVAGWSLTGNLNCVDPTTNSTINLGTRTATINLAAGENVTCTFVNTLQTGNIIIVKDAVPNDAQDFAFTNNFGNSNPASFSLDDDADGTLSNSRNSVVTAGTYSVSEGAVSGWAQTSATCSDGSPINAVVVSAGETVTCTFTNTKNPNLTLLKTVVNDNGGAAADTAWTLTASGPSNISGVEGNASVTNVSVNPGAYTLAETDGPTGYTGSTYSCVKNNDAPVVSNSISLAAGDNATCTITNNDNAPSLTLNKIVVNDNGGTSAESAWTLTANGGSGSPTNLSGPGAAGSADVVSGATFKADTYTLAESTGPLGYSASAWTCTNGVTVNGSSQITLGLGQSTVCSITNNDQGAQLTLLKTVTNDNGGSALATAWTLAAAGPTPISGTTGAAAVTNAAVNLGTYTLSETDGPSGYTGSTYSCVKNGGGAVVSNSISLAAADNATCTINNNDNAPSLTLVKEVINDNGGTAVPADWTLTAAGYDAGSPDAGTYTISESGGPAGYTQTSLTCSNSGTNQVTSVTLALGESVTCTFVNNDNTPKLHLRKIVTNDNGGSATVADFTLTADGATTNDITGTSPVDSGATLKADTFALSETTLPGYTASAWSCVGGTQVGANITLGLGEEATCTITNDDIAPKLHLRKVVVNDNGGTALAAAWTLTADGATTNNVTGNSPVDSTASLLADTFALSESGGPSGYSASVWSCVGGTQNGANITLGIGGEATCTITNNDQPAHLIVVKHVDNGNTGATTAASAFTTTITGVTTSNQSATGAEAPGVDNTLTTIGAYSIDEGAHVGYNKILSSGCSGTIALGETKTCTITNTAIAPRLTLIKTVINGNGGTKVVADFPLFVDATGVTSGTANNTTIGAHTASETGNVGYLASDWGGDCAENGSVTLALADDKTCTITNDDIAPKLHLRKVVTNDNGGTKTIADFTLTANGTGANDLSGTSPVDSDGTLKADTFALSETNVTGYNASAWTCVGGTQVGANITLGINEEATCTITNDDIAPSLTLNKVTSYQYGGNAPESSWTLTADGGSAGLLSGPGAAGSADVVSSNTFQAGTYTLSESAASTGYQNGTSYSCVKNGGTAVSSNSLALGVGDSATCTITNTDLPAHIIVIKHVINDNGNDAVASDFTMRLTGTQLSQNDFAGSETGVDVTLDAGAYTVDETNSAGYIKTLSADCSGTVAVGQTKTCTITNNDKPMATRTQGFWQTHTVYTSSVFSGKSWTIGTKVIDTPAELFAGFYASIPKTTTGAKRTSLDHARMQMLQQWLAAKLNCAAFGCSSTTQTLLTNAATAFSGTNKTLILNYASQLDAYNNSNDALLISGQGKATPQTSQSTASTQLSFWNILP